MVQLLEQKVFEIPDLEGNIEVTLRNIDEYRIDHTNLVPLLFQAGYLTIKDYDRDLDFYFLGFPNDEVKYAFVDRLMQVYTSACQDGSHPFMISKFVRKMRAGDIDGVLSLIQSLMASIPYDSLPADKVFLREYNYQTTIYLIFLLMGQYTRSEVHSSKGRSDVEVETSCAIYIFEFKVGGEPINAISQIKEAGYAEKHRASGKDIFLIGAVINQDMRTLNNWQIEAHPLDKGQKLH